MADIFKNLIRAILFARMLVCQYKTSIYNTLIAILYLTYFSVFQLVDLAKLYANLYIETSKYNLHQFVTGQ